MARLDLTNRDIGKLIIAAMLGFAALGFLGFGTINPNLARDFLILAGGLLTSETARQAIQTARSRRGGDYRHERQATRNAREAERERERPDASKDSKDKTE
jgi:hypothetical protein